MRRWIPMGLLLVVAAAPPLYQLGSRILKEREAIRRMLAVPPGAINVSPSGQWILVKDPHISDVTLTALERVSHKPAGVCRVENTQLGSRAWRNDSRLLLLFVDGSGGTEGYRLIFCRMPEGTLQPVSAEPTFSASIRWAPTGSRLAYISETARGARSLMIVDSDETAPKAHLVADGLSKEAGFFWSPDSQSLVYALDKDEWALHLSSITNPSVKKRIPFLPRAEIRSMAWSSDGKKLLVSARAPGSEFFSLYQVEISSGRITKAIEEIGDISGPLYLPQRDDYVFHVTKDSETTLCLKTAKTGKITRLSADRGSHTVTGFSIDGKKAFIHHRKLDGPAALYELDLNSLSSTPLYEPKIADSGVLPEPLQIRSFDGLVVPAYLWRAPAATRRNKAVVYLHGAKTQMGSLWDPLFQYYLSKGFDVMGVNFRGSHGYGASFEALSSDVEGAAKDVVAGIHHLNSLGVPPENIVVIGASAGANIAALTGMMAPNLGGLVFLSAAFKKTIPLPKIRVKGPVFAFHGENDRYYPPETIRNKMEETFGKVTFKTFSREPHIFRQIASTAKIQATIAEMGE